MNFETKRKVENSVFSVTVAFGSYGTSEMDESEELALFEDLGYPSINLGAMTFEGYFGVDGDKRVIDADETDGDKVSFIMNAKKLTIDSNFTVTYSVDARSIAPSELGKNLTTNRLVAEAKALLFQEKIHKAITAAVSAVKAERTRFETETVPTLTV